MVGKETKKEERRRRRMWGDERWTK